MKTGSHITKNILHDLAKSSLKSINPDSEILDLRLNRFFFLFGLFCFALTIFFMITVYIYPKETGAEGQESILLFVSYIFALLGIYFLSGHFFHRVRCDSDSITVQSFYGKNRSAKWSEITKVTFRQSTNLVTLHLDNGKKIKLSQYFIGLADLFNLIESKTNISLCDIKNKMIRI